MKRTHQKSFSPVPPSWSTKSKRPPIFKANWDTTKSTPLQPITMQSCVVAGWTFTLNVFRFLLTDHVFGSIWLTSGTPLCSLKLTHVNLKGFLPHFKTSTPPLLLSCRVNGEPALRWSGKVCLSFSIQPHPIPPGSTLSAASNFVWGERT